MAQTKKSNSNTQPKWPLWAAVAVAALLVASGVALLFSGGGAAGGTPKAVVEQPVIDVGYQSYKTQVQNDFKITNAGDGPLSILGQPKVELIEGCWPPLAVVSSTTIQPGESAAVSMGYTMTEGMGGPHQFKVIVRTNDPANPELVLVAKSDWGP